MESLTLFKTHILNCSLSVLRIYPWVEEIQTSLGIPSQLCPPLTPWILKVLQLRISFLFDLLVSLVWWILTSLLPSDGLIPLRRRKIVGLVMFTAKLQAHTHIHSVGTHTAYTYTLHVHTHAGTHSLSILRFKVVFTRLVLRNVEGLPHSSLSFEESLQNVQNSLGRGPWTLKYSEN